METSTTSTTEPTSGGTSTNTNTNTSTNTTLDINPILTNQEKHYNMDHDYFLISIALNGLIVALLAVIIFVKGFQSNAR